MILWSEPITNEPGELPHVPYCMAQIEPVSAAGFEREIKSQKSRAYNANVRRMVVHIAMLEYLKNPPEGFEEIIKTHFKLKARSLKKQLDKWLEEDDGKPLHADSMTAIRAYSAGTSASAAAQVGAAGITAPVAAASGEAGADGASTPDGSVTPTAASSKPLTAFAKDVEEVKKLLTKLEMKE